MPYFAPGNPATLAVGIGAVVGANSLMQLGGNPLPSSGGQGRQIRGTGVVPATTTGTHIIFQGTISLEATPFVLASLQQFTASDASVSGGASIGTQVGFVAADMVAAGTNTGFQGALSAGANKRNFYGLGTAINEFNGQLLINIDRPMQFTAQTSAAAAQVGTLNNAPAAGNPTHWLKVLVNGVNLAIPCWPG